MEAFMYLRSGALIGVALCGVISLCTAADRKAESRDMELIGYSDLQARSAYQPVIQKQGARWIAYIGHHAGIVPNPLTGREEPNGTSVVDVTDPAHPKYIAHIPGELVQSGGGDAGGAQMA